MLDTPNRYTNNILKLAELIENLPPEHYDQSKWNTSDGRGGCLCHWALEQSRSAMPGLLGSYDNITRASDYLGISYEKAGPLFVSCPEKVGGPSNPTPAQAARVLRHLAITGKVDWSIAKSKELVNA